MSKRITALALVLALAASLFIGLSACGEKQLTIVYLGDSIAEGIAGMSPLSERERYAYYGVLGIRNNYIYKNRAVSADQSKHLKALIKEEDTDIRMIRSTLKSADIIHISILGNDLLLNGLGNSILEIATGNLDRIESLLDRAEGNFIEIVETLKSLNPNAVLMFQTVYNPAYPGSTLIGEAERESLAELGIFEDDYRRVSSETLARLNNIIKDYLRDHPGSYYIMDATAEFQRIYDEDPVRGLGLIFSDDIHPSIEGHAVLADLTQQKLEQLGLANAKQALSRYKKLRNKQLTELYSGSLDIKPIKRRINSAKSNAEVTKIYFAAIKGKTPVYCA